MSKLIKITVLACLCLLQMGAAMADRKKEAVSASVSHYNEMADVGVLSLASWKGRSYRGHALGLVTEASRGGSHSVRFVDQKDGWLNRQGVVSDQSRFYFARDREDGDLCRIIRTDVALTSEDIIFETAGECGLLGAITHQGDDYLLFNRVNETHRYRGVDIPNDVSLMVIRVGTNDEVQVVSDTTGVYENSTGILIDSKLGFIKAANPPGKGVNPVPSLFLAYRLDDLTNNTVQTFADINSAYEYLSALGANPVGAQFLHERTKPANRDLDNDELLITLNERSDSAFFRTKYTGEVLTAASIGFDLKGSALVLPARTEESTSVSYLYFQHDGQIPWKRTQSGTLDVQGIQNFIKR